VVMAVVKGHLLLLLLLLLSLTEMNRCKWIFLPFASVD
jgi:hypothetical protein